MAQASGESKSRDLEVAFAAQCDNISASLATTTLVSMPELKQKINSLRELLTQGAEWWTNYELRTGAEKLRNLESAVDQVSLRLKPRRKFKFSRGLESPECSDPQPPPILTPAPPPLTNGIVIDCDSVKEQHVSRQVQGEHVSIVGLTDVTISLTGTGGALRLANLKHCIIKDVHISGSVFMSDCNECQIEVVCHQLRIHRSRTCCIWTCCISAPIIEESSDMKFGKLDYKGLNSRWSDVKDFNWLHDRPSPNWSLLDSKRTRACLD